MGKDHVRVLRKLGMPLHHPIPKASQPKLYGYSVEVASFRRTGRWDGKRSYHWYETKRARDQAAADMRKDKLYGDNPGEHRPGMQLKLYRDLRLEQR